MKLDPRRTAPDRRVTAARLILAVIFLSAGAMKLIVPMLADAFSGQLEEAGLPLISLTRVTLPWIEIALGLALAIGWHVRLAALLAIGLMIPATYVHLVVHDPELFPLQPSQPVVPAVVVLLGLFVLWRGGGAGSLDLLASEDPS